MPIFWLIFWTLVLSVAWLVPNHFQPWTTFHSDAWAAMAGLLGASALVFGYHRRQAVIWRAFPLVALGLVAVPWLQWVTGLLFFAGQAWMSSIYLLGLTLAVLVGIRWEHARPGQLPAAVLAAACIASILSVGLQLYNWLDLNSNEITSIWSMGLSGDRPYANVGQPNILASLLLWGVLAALLAYQRRVLHAPVAVLLVAFLLIGLALTQSRAGQLSLTLILVALWLWRRQWRSAHLPWVATVLYAAFWALLFLLPEVMRSLLITESDSYLRGIHAGDGRLMGWKVLGRAVLERPLWGYGWTEIAAAQVEVAEQFPPLGSLFGHAHNLFLDFVLWLGLPLGLALTAFVVWWVVTTVRSLQTVTQYVTFLAVGVLGVHAMLELPLHYAFFLIPAGFLIGVLCTSDSDQWQFKTPWWTLAVLWVLTAGALVVTVRDYLHTEASYYALRFEKARINVEQNGPGTPPDTWVLTQMHAVIWAERYVPKAGASQEELQTLDHLARRFASPGPIYRVAKTYALNGRTAEASGWLGKLCKFTDERGCVLVQGLWKQESETNPGMAAVVWPKD